MPDHATVKAQAKQLRESARQHKRHAESHRRKAKEEMQESVKLERFLGELGVPVVLEDEKGTPTDGSAVRDDSQ